MLGRLVCKAVFVLRPVFWCLLVHSFFYPVYTLYITPSHTHSRFTRTTGFGLHPLRGRKDMLGLCRATEKVSMLGRPK